MPEPAPVILYSPELSISDMAPTTPAYVSLRCLMSHIEMTPEVSTVEVKTACGIREYPGTVKWTLKASLYHSFDPVGTNAVLTAAVEGEVPVDFKVIPNMNKPVGADNPLFYGQLIPQPFTPLSGDVGDASSFDLEWSITGWSTVPLTSETDPPVAREASTSSKTAKVPAPA